GSAFSGGHASAGRGHSRSFPNWNRKHEGYEGKSMNRTRISRFCDFVISRFGKPECLRSSITRRRNQPTIRFSVLLLLLACSTVTFADNSLQQIVKRVDARYNHLTTLKANFQENYSGAGVTRNESGELWLQKP